MTTTTEAHLVHGMGTEPAAPDWPALTADEVTDVCRAYAEAVGPGTPRLRWLSPRPLSAGAIVAVGGAEFFVKRHHESVRRPASLVEEHAFLAHLRSHGAPVVRVLADDAGRTVHQRGAWNYELHTIGAGHDVYRDAISWSPFAEPDHAYAAGEALARLHVAAHGFDAPHRGPAPLIAGFTVFASEDPLRAVETYAAERPAVAAELAERPHWRDELMRWHLPFHEQLRPWLAQLEASWAHGDFHASNLLWQDGRVSSVIDFSLSDRAYAVHDLATAIERNAVEWVELDEKGAKAVHADAARALIAGYRKVRELSTAERAALPELLPLCHVDYALSEIDYFRGVTRSAQNTELAYRYLVDHTAWFAGPVGSALLDEIREELAK